MEKFKKLILGALSSSQKSFVVDYHTSKMKNNQQLNENILIFSLNCSNILKKQKVSPIICVN